MGDQITALKVTSNQIATKVHKMAPQGVVTESEPRETFYRWHVESVDCLESLSSVLTRMERAEKWLAVRGSLIGSPPPDIVRRTYKRNRMTGEMPFLEVCDRSWLCIDIDAMPAPKGVDHVQYAISQLPSYFHGVACHYQYSSSHGVKDADQIRLHLWYWLDRPACCFSLRRWSKCVPYVDPMLYNPVQPHFTAAPRFVGMDDPVAKRSGLLPGWPVLSLPDEVLCLDDHNELVERESLADEKRRAEAAKIAVTRASSDDSRKRYAQAALVNACKRIMTASEGSRHYTVFMEAACIGELVHVIGEQEARSALENAALVALPGARSGEAIRTVNDGLSEGMQDPRDLSHIGAPWTPRPRNNKPSGPRTASDIRAWSNGLPLADEHFDTPENYMALEREAIHAEAYRAENRDPPIGQVVHDFFDEMGREFALEMKRSMTPGRAKYDVEI